MFQSCSMYWYFTPFHDRAIYHGLDMLHIAYPFINWWTLGMFPLFSYYKKCYNEHSYIRFCVDMFSFLLCMPDWNGCHMVTVYNIFQEVPTVFQSDDDI